MFGFFKTKIKVAIVAPPFGDTGGPEVVAQILAESLLDLGVEVTLFAPADWKTKAAHIPTLDKSIWNMINLKGMDSGILRNFVTASQVKIIDYQDDFDIIHLHSQTYAYAIAKNLRKPCVLSLHNRFTRGFLKQIKQAGIYPVALSRSQRGQQRVSAVIMNGVPTADITYSVERGQYLIFVGRLTDQKGVDTAIQIALKAKKKLLIFGRIGNSEKRQRFYQKKIAPYLNKRVIYKGEVGHNEIYEYLRGAEALLFPIRRPEVCPMVMAEAWACGTPVIGSKVDPLPEMVKNKKVAFLSDNFNDLVAAVKNLDQFDRLECRNYAETYFDSKVMAGRYLELYKKILKK
ncbi:TPA: hypothetical protein DF272_06125 [Candidatus Falkowbacteria bacterium]|nr:hypothetical protein [Candidatus Falkowbacteria bacterium]